MNPSLLSLASPVVALLGLIIGGGGVLTWGRSARLRAAVTSAKAMKEALGSNGTEEANMEVLARARARQLLSEQGEDARKQGQRVRRQVFLITVGLYFIGVAFALQTRDGNDLTVWRALIGLAAIASGSIWWWRTRKEASKRRHEALNPAGPMGVPLDPPTHF